MTMVDFLSSGFASTFAALLFVVGVWWFLTGDYVRCMAAFIGMGIVGVAYALMDGEDA